MKEKEDLFLELKSNLEGNKKKILHSLQYLNENYKSNQAEYSKRNLLGTIIKNNHIHSQVQLDINIKGINHSNSIKEQDEPSKKKLHLIKIPEINKMQ